MPGTDALVDEEAYDADEQRYTYGRGGKDVVFHAQRASAYGAGDDRGYPGHGGDEEPGPRSHARQRGEVGQQVLGRAGYEDEQEHQRVAFFRRVEEAQVLYLLNGEKYLHGLDAEAAHEEIYQHAADYRAGHAQQGALHGAEGVAGAHLNGLAGDDGDHNLQDLYAEEVYASHVSCAVHPGPEFFRVLDVLYERPAYKPGYRQRKYDENGNGCAG